VSGDSERDRGPEAPPTGAFLPVTGVGEIPGPVFVRWFGTIFVLMAIGVIVGGYYITGGVRRTAAETDNAVRTVAWELLRWSTGHDGTFPTSETAFIDGLRHAADPPAPPAAATPGDADAWPADARTALQGRKPANIPDALARLKIEWPSKPELAPEIGTDGKPTLPGTMSAVRGWLGAWVEQHQRPS